MSPEISRVTAFSTQDAIEAAQRQIDQQLVTLLEKAHALRRQRNSITLISRLPTEVLCRIFEIARDVDEDERPDSTSPKICVSISHVYSAWRTTALCFPSLWNHIHDSYAPLWVKQMRIRSAAVPLDIHVEAYNGEEDFDLNKFSWILSNVTVKRLRGLTILNVGCGVPLFEKKCPSIFQCHAPLLEEAVISFASNFISKNQTLERLFCKGTPRLRQLTMENCLLPWESPALRSPLTLLELNSNCSKTTWTITQLTAVLENLPFLNTLELNNVLAPVDDTFSPSSIQRTIALPALKRLTITGWTFSGCSRLLDQLTLTPTPFITLDCLIHKVSCRPLSISSVSYVHDMLQVCADTILHLGWNFDKSISTVTLTARRDSKELPLFTLTLRVHVHDLQLMLSLLAALPPTGIRRLFIEHSCPQAWLSALSPLVHVKAVCIINPEQVRGMMGILAHPVEVSEAATQLLFPALYMVELATCTLSSSVNASWVRDADLFEGLRDALRTRQKYGCGVDTVTFTWSVLTEDQLNQLREVVGTVVCKQEMGNKILVGDGSCK